MSSNESLTVNILTGFLGAGKTTLLNRLLASPEMANAAVIINEFGEVSLDHLLVEQGDDDVIELSSGCLCCTIRGELISTLERLLERDDAERLSMIVIETTGLADPVPVMQAVMAHPALSHRLSLGSVITLVDAVNGISTLEKYEEARKQVAVADCILVSKSDLTSDMSPVLAHINRYNATVSPTNVEDLDDADLINRLSASFFALSQKQETVREWFAHDVAHHHHHHDHEHDKTRHGASIRSFSLVRDTPIQKEALRAFLDLLASQHGPHLLRVKGLIYVADHPDQPVLIHGVQTVFHPPKILSTWPDEERLTRIVFIVDGLDEAFVKRLFDGFSGVPRVDQADHAAMADNPLAISGFSGSKQS